MCLLVLLFANAIGLAGAFGAVPEEKYPVEIVPQMGHLGEVSSIAFSPDGKNVLSGSSDKTLRLWDITGRLIRKIEMPPNN